MIPVRRIAGTYQELLRATVAALHSLGYEEIKADSGVGLVTGMRSLGLNATGLAVALVY